MYTDFEHSKCCTLNFSLLYVYLKMYVVSKNTRKYNTIIHISVLTAIYKYRK